MLYVTQFCHIGFVFFPNNFFLLNMHKHVYWFQKKKVCSTTFVLKHFVIQATSSEESLFKIKIKIQFNFFIQIYLFS